MNKQQAVADYLRDNIHLIRDRDFTTLYANIGTDNVSTLTKILFDCDINPLLYMTEVPLNFANNLSSIEDITIPDSATIIDVRAFSSCVNLTSVKFDENSKLKRIGGSAFSGCFRLKSIEIPNGVTSIDSWAFSYCDSLTSIELPNSLTHIGSSAFARCPALSNIHYEGTKREWKSININWSAFEFTKDIIIHCTNGDIEYK